jgi:glucose/mannose-6-phosphate isomerase
MLDDPNILKQHDSWKDLEYASLQYEQAKFVANVLNGDNDHRSIFNVVIAGMGGSALAALTAKNWLGAELKIPIDVVRTYDLPNYVNKNTLVIISSYSGNTEEVISCLSQAQTRDCQIAIVTSGGKLMDQAVTDRIAYVTLPTRLQPRMALICTLCSLIALLANFEIISDSKLDEIASKSDWLRLETSKWIGDIPTDDNHAKKLALKAVGKTAVFYGGALSASVAYKWKVCWNETAKNVAFWNEFPEFDHNELIGWTSHPVEKPFVLFDIISSLENPQILKRFEISDRLLSGLRPKSISINLAGETLIEQLLWGTVLADFVSIYLAVLNGVSPTSVELIEKLKRELVI